MIIPAMVTLHIVSAALYAAETGASAPPASAPIYSSGVKSGTLEFAAITEASGLAASRKNPGVLWVHNDSGDTARIFALTPTGRHLGMYSIDGARACDWEDMAAGPGPDPQKHYLYLGDIGDNFAVRSSITVYRVPEPSVTPSQSSVTAKLSGVETFRLKYEDGARDAETLMIDPHTGDLYIVSKREARSRLYCVPATELRSGSTATLKFITELPWTGATSGDISPDGSKIIIRGYKNAMLWERPAGSSIGEALSKPGTDVPLKSDPQGEAIAFDASSRGYYTVSEGRDAPIYYFEPLK